LKVNDKRTRVAHYLASLPVMAGLASGFRQHGIDALAVGRPLAGRLGLGVPSLACPKAFRVPPAHAGAQCARTVQE